MKWINRNPGLQVENKAILLSFFFPFSSHSYLAQPDMDIGMTGHNFSQQQAPPNQTAPWPESMMPIDQTFANQNRYSSNLIVHDIY